MGDHKQTCGIYPALWWYGPNRKGVLVYRCDFDAPLFFISVTHRRITHLLDSEVGGERVRTSIETERYFVSFARAYGCTMLAS